MQEHRVPTSKKQVDVGLLHIGVSVCALRVDKAAMKRKNCDALFLTRFRLCFSGLEVVSGTAQEGR